VANRVDNSISVLDSATGQVASTVEEIRNPELLAVRPDGERLYVGSEGRDIVTVIETGTNAVLVSLKVGINSELQEIKAGHDGTQLYLLSRRDTTDRIHGTVWFLRTDSHAVLGSVMVGRGPQVVVENAGLSRLYVVNEDSGDVSVIDTASRRVVETIPVGRTPRSAALSPDGKQLFVTNWSDRSISVIDTTSNQVTTTVKLGSLPGLVVVKP
jgi:YVTN family beta-propeller protein